MSALDLLLWASLPFGLAVWAALLYALAGRLGAGRLKRWLVVHTPPGWLYDVASLWVRALWRGDDLPSPRIMAEVAQRLCPKGNLRGHVVRPQMARIVRRARRLRRGE